MSRRPNRLVSLFIVFIFGALGASVPSLASAATHVYYSVGQNTSDHKTGSPTVTISGSTATFSVAQTAANMGVGDIVNYGAVGRVFITGKTSSTVWSVATATGTVPAATTTATVTSITHAFSSLRNALNNGTANNATSTNFLNTSNLVTGDYVLNVPLYYDSGPDVIALTIGGFTTDATRYINVYTPTSTVSQVNESQRHNGTYQANKWSLESSNNDLLNVDVAFLRLDGIQVKFNQNTSTASAVKFLSTIPSGGDIWLTNSIVRGVITGGVSATGIQLQSSGAGTRTAKIWNNLVYGFAWGATSTFTGMAINASWTPYVFNNTFWGNYNSINRNAGNGVVFNNILSSTTNPTFDFSGNVTANYNATDAVSIGTGNGSNSRSGQTFSFVDVANRNFRLTQSDAGARDFGINLSSTSSLPFNVDMDYDVRPQGSAWDIGMDEYVVDVTAPIISAVATSSVAATSLTVTWTTDEAASSTVRYGLTTAYGSTTHDGSFVTSHSVPVTGLQPLTLYHYRVESADSSGNVATSSDGTFTTGENIPPVISAIASSTSYTTAIITWTTDEAASSTVDYGLTTSYGSATSTSLATTSHVARISGLSADTTYNFRISVWDAGLNQATSSNLTFRTRAFAPTTYYVDYGSGSDLNSGISTSSPWKLAPAMLGFSGSYTHVSGDDFVFKGGVTWPGSAFPMTISNSGVATNTALYTVDESWYTGGAYSKPIFDGGGTVTLFSGIINLNASYVTINGLKLQNAGTTGVTRDVSAIKQGSGAFHHVTISNNTMAPYASHVVVLNYDGSASVVGATITDNDFSNAANLLELGSNYAGSNKYTGPIIDGNTFHDMTSNLLDGDHGDGIHLWNTVGTKSYINTVISNNRWYGNFAGGDAVTSNTAQIFIENSIDGLEIFNNILSHDDTSSPTRDPNGALGSTIATNGTFAADSNWTKGTGWTISGGVATHAAGTASSLSQTLTATADRGYRVDYTVSGRTAGSVNVTFGGVTGLPLTPATSNASFYTWWKATTTSPVIAFTATSDFDGSIDNVTVREMLDESPMFSPGFMSISGSSNVKLYNNTVIGDANSGGVEVGGKACAIFVSVTTVDIRNNIFSKCSYGLGLPLDVTGYTVNNNAYYFRPSRLFPGKLGANDATLAEFQAVGLESNGLNNQNPLFVSITPGSIDAQLQAASPAKNAGATLGAAYSTDYAGVSRPQGAAWDIGAYEATSASAPSVTTSAASSVGQNSATLNGLISATGGNNATESGFAYGTSPTLATGASTSTLGAQTGTASFNEAITSLACNTTYYFRAYATNVTGTGFGSIVSFTTSACSAPSVTTSAASSVAKTSAVLNGSITATGGASATQSGFAYGTSSALVTGVSTTTLGAQAGAASFSSSVSSLTCETTYYFRAYATNVAATAFGSIVSLTTSSCADPAVSESSPSRPSSGGSVARRVANLASSQPNGTLTLSQFIDVLISIGIIPSDKAAAARAAISAQAPASAFTRHLQLHDSGPDVRSLQSLLAAKGYLKAAPNGVFGPATYAALRAFQAANGVPATGFFGPLTRAAIAQ